MHIICLLNLYVSLKVILVTTTKRVRKQLFLKSQKACDNIRIQKYVYIFVALEQNIHVVHTYELYLNSLKVAQNDFVVRYSCIVDRI